jgi:hypothetical protein
MRKQSFAQDFAWQELQPCYVEGANRFLIRLRADFDSPFIGAN